MWTVPFNNHHIKGILNVDILFSLFRKFTFRINIEIIVLYNYKRYEKVISKDS